MFDARELTLSGGSRASSLYATMDREAARVA
jgi:hypothetical protein